ncbi:MULTISPECIES: GNAT family N-acetyltransferase [unclassified Mycobacterium]|uniref:GNAT family N-acetyltransferase n=1 Tax=unclassified Mycobacterium TaxID=2642494 RepID=UPI0029C7909A|nr:MULTISPECIES: GNAT family N-acetyltransferase [unclassified Mycobacterium]
MNVRLYSTPADFGAVARWVYRRDPVRYTLELTTLRTATWPDRRILASFVDRGVIGAAVQGSDGCLLVSGLPVELAGEAATALAPVGLRSVRGARPAAEAFTDAWCDVTDGQAVPTTEDVLYRLGDLVPPTGVPGRERPALDVDDELIVDWLDEFLVEAFGYAPDRAARVGYLREIVDAGGRFVLWTVDDVPVSMARVHAPAVGTSRIGPVYTPPEHRGHGYAAAVTSAAVALAKRTGARDVVLFADVANPVSNGVYRRIGFVPVAEHVHFELTVKPEAAAARCGSPGVSGRTRVARVAARSAR